MTNEQIAHDLAIVYLRNRYGVDISGDFSMNQGERDGVRSGRGQVETKHFPGFEKIRYERVGTGETGLFGLQKTKKVEAGYEIDLLFEQIVEEYCLAYERFLLLLERRQR